VKLVRADVGTVMVVPEVGITVAATPETIVEEI